MKLKKLGTYLLLILGVSATTSIIAKATDGFKNNIFDSINLSDEFNGFTSIRKLDLTLPYENENYECVTVGNKIYMVGNTKSVVIVYDVQRGTFEELDLDYTLFGSDMAIASVNEDIYLFGGRNINALDNVLKLNTKTNELTLLDVKLPYPMSDSTAVVVDKDIYLFGGSSQSDKSRTSIYKFNTVKETFNELDVKLPKGLWSISATLVDNKIYLFGGVESWSPVDGITYSKSVYVFDVNNKCIEELDIEVPYYVIDGSVISIDNKVYLFGGKDETSLKDTIIEFDINTNKFDELNLKLGEKLYSVNVLAINDVAYVLGGYNGEVDINSIYKVK
jgi:N-acetylneuraminic acid mutarotase